MSKTNLSLDPEGDGPGCLILAVTAFLCITACEIVKLIWK